MTTPADPDKQPNQPVTQELQFSNVGARVPEKVARGVFATGAFVLQGPTEFALDFVLRMNKPQQIVARVFLPVNLVPQVIDTLKANLDKYRHAHGPLPGAAATPAPAPVGGGGGNTATVTPPPPAVNVDEVYQDLKMSEDVMVGVYANALLVVHSAADFCLDFIVNLYPRAVITSRIFLSAPQVPILLSSLTQAWQNWQTKRQPPRPAP